MAQAEVYVSNLVRALITGAKPSSNSIQAVHAAFVGAVAAEPAMADPPRPRGY